MSEPESEYERTNRDETNPDGRPWSNLGPGPRVRLVARLPNPGKSQHHALEESAINPPPPPSVEDIKRQFGGDFVDLPMPEVFQGFPILEPVPTAIYDCFEIGPEGMRDTGSGEKGAPCQPWDPSHGQAWFGMSVLRGKTEQEISPYIQYSGGYKGVSLPMPRVFDARRMSLVFQPLLAWWEPGSAGHVVAPYAEEGILTSQLRADVAAIKSAGTFRFRIGIKDYLQGPLALLPQPTGLTIPPRQLFFAEVKFTVLPALRYTWRVYVRVEGFIGLEVM